MEDSFDKTVREEIYPLCVEKVKGWSGLEISKLVFMKLGSMSNLTLLVKVAPDESLAKISPQRIIFKKFAQNKLSRLLMRDREN
jgi:hypothetical protein